MSKDSSVTARSTVRSPSPERKAAEESEAATRRKVRAGALARVYAETAKVDAPRHKKPYDMPPGGRDRYGVRMIPPLDREEAWKMSPARRTHFVNEDELLNAMSRPPGRGDREIVETLFDMGDAMRSSEERAATRIQAAFRGRKARRKVEEARRKKEEYARMYEEYNAAVKMQSTFRGSKTRKSVQSMKTKRTATADSDAGSYDVPEDDFEAFDDSDDEEKTKAAIKMQAVARGRLSRKETLKRQETQRNALINARDKTIGDVRRAVEENLAMRRELMMNLNSANIPVPATIEAQRLLSIVALDTDQLPKLVAVFEKVKGEREILMRRKAGYK
jgi:hypothetical protein